MPGWNYSKYLGAIALFALLAVLLIWFSIWKISRLEQKLQSELVHELTDFVESIDAQKLLLLQLRPADTVNPVFHRFHRQFENYQRQVRDKEFFIINPREDTFFLSMYHKPFAGLRAGDVYPYHHDVLRRSMQSLLPEIAIPGKADSMNYVKAYVPLINRTTGETLLLIGLRTPAERYFGVINSSRLRNFGSSGLVMLLLLSLIYAIYRRDQSPHRIRYKYRHIETLLVALAGLVLTGVAYVNLKQMNQEEHYRQLSNQAAMHTGTVRMSFHEIMDNITTLSNYFSNSDYVDADEFPSFTATFSAHDAALAYGFAPLVYNPFNEANPYANNALQMAHISNRYTNLIPLGMPHGLDSTVMMSPLLYLTHASYAHAFRGTNLMQHPELFRAMERAYVEGIPTASPLLPATSTGWDEDLIFVFDPVYAKDYETPDHKKTHEDLYGFSIGVINPRQLFDMSISHVRWSGHIAMAGLLEMTADADDRLIAVYPQPYTDAEDMESYRKLFSSGKPHFRHPIFVFGRSYALLIQPEAISLGAPAFGLWMIIFGGLLVTGLLAILLWFQRNRWSRLQYIIDRKTADLNQRIRELNAMQQVNVQMQHAESPAHFCKAVTRQLAVALANGRRIAVVFTYDGKHYEAGAGIKEPAAELTSEFIILDGKHGKLILRIAERAALNENDQPLLDQLALALGRWFERHHMEEALRQSEERFRQLVENAFDAIYLMEDRHYNYVNERFVELTGYTSDELTRPDFNYETLLTEHSRVILELRYAAREMGEALKPQYETQLLTKSGQIRDVEVSTVSIGDKRKVMVMGIMRDITERKKSQKALLKRDEELQQKNRELLAAKEMAEAGDKLKTAFLNNISHEVRTPLNGILGAAALIADPHATAEERNEMTEIISVATQRLLRTITQYMDISLLSSNNMAVYKEKIELKLLLDPVLHEFETACRQKGLSFEKDIHIPLENMHILTDKSLLLKVLHHLLDNAVKFTNKGKVGFGCHYKQSEIAFYVADTGIGIDPAVQQKVFTEFMQEDSSNVRRYEGSGLGLAICKHALDLLGGKIWFETEKNKGSVFHFVIPADSETNDTIKVEAPTPHPEQYEPPLILFAEDEDSNYQVLELILRKKTNARVLRAHNGQEAVDFCRDKPEIELVLMDIKMPVMDGYEATQLIKKMRPELPVVAITAYGLSGDKHKSLEAGCDDYMAKPIKKEDLLEMVEKYGVELKA